MKVNKSQKAWLCLLGLGLGALGLDRVLGDAAEAGTAGVDASAGRPAPGASAETPRVSDAVTAVFNEKLARRLDALAASNPMPQTVRDAFTPPPATTATFVAEAPRVVWADRAPAFKASHRLQAVVESASGGQAMVDGRLLTVGQTLDGFKLTAVGRFAAVFNDGHTDAELRLKAPALSDAASSVVGRLAD